MAARAYRTIVIATDFSDPAYVAVQYGLDLASRLGAKAQIVYVTPRLEPAVPFHRRNRKVVDELQKEEMAAAEQALAKLADEGDVPVTTRVLVGRPADEILAHARRVRASLIVMAKHGRSATEQLLIGSVTERVLQKSPVPVAVVPIVPRPRRRS